MRGRRFWRGLRWRGAVMLMLVVALVGVGLKLLSLHNEFGFSFDPMTFVRPLFYAALILVPIVITWGRYKRTVRVESYEETLARLMKSREEFCLILRPFGSDGEISLPYRWHGALTMEQVVARAARKFQGFRTYAMVDQDRRLAPPGPVFLRAPHDGWQPAVRQLIARAHSIVLIVPPGQDIRSSFDWEIRQITEHELQSRTIIVLPPDRLHKKDYPVALQQACVLLATLDGFAGSIDDASSLLVHDLELSLPSRTHVMKYSRANVWNRPVPIYWHVAKRRVAWVKFYIDALVDAFSMTEKELSELGFPARYPHDPQGSPLGGLNLLGANRRETRQPVNLSGTKWNFLTKSGRRRWTAAALAIAVVLVAVIAVLQSTARQRAHLAAADLAEKAARLAPYDSYGAVQLALRAYRTDPDVNFGIPGPHVYPGTDRLLPDYTMARRDRSTPTTSSGTGMEEVNQFAEVMSTKISGDGTRVVSTNSANHVVVSNIEDEQVRLSPLTNLFNEDDIARNVVISRSGRYVAFLQTVYPAIPKNVDGPVDENGLPKPDPNSVRTCAVKTLADVVTCLVVYNVDTGKVVVAAPMGGLGTFVSMISIDPTDKVVAAVMPGSFNPLSAESANNTLRRWDLRNGREWKPQRVPWRSWWTGMWLRPGGSSAVVRELIPDTTGTRPERHALSISDLGPTPTRRELAADAKDTEMSLDWHTVAAVQSPVGNSPGITVWDTESGEVTTRVDSLSSEQTAGYLGVNRDGTTLILSWRTTPPANPPTDIRKYPISGSLSLAAWSLPDGTPLEAPDNLEEAWTRVIPLGDTLDGPLALTRTSIVGLTLPKPGEAPPMHRMASTHEPSALDNDDLANRLCGLLADPNNDATVRKLMPPGASQEPLCPT